MSSLSIGSGSHTAGCPAMRSWYQRSRPSVNGCSPSVLRTVITCSIEGVSFKASSRFALPVIGDLVAAATLHVPVQAVVGDVQRPAEEPLHPGRVPLADLVPVLEPIELPGPLLPERLRVPRRLVVDARVVPQSARGE